MADWKIFRDKIKLIPHPDPAVERLELGIVGGFQVVVGKGIFKDGTVVIFAPDKSLLPNEIADEGDRRKYLVGPQQNRVKAIKLRNELSCGIILDDRPEFADIPLGEDISERLGITKYEPPLPHGLQGRVKPIGNIDVAGHAINRHDVEHFNIYAQEFVEGEEVIVTEKVHGSQIAIIRAVDGRRMISSKGLLGRGLTIDEDETNTYWRAAKNTGIFDILDEVWPNQHVQVFAEVVPCQKNFTYGFKDPSILIFRVEVDNVNITGQWMPEKIFDLWVPILYRGVFNAEEVRKLRSGKEQVSGKELHIREGVVVQPAVARNSVKGGFNLMLKIINPAYKECGEEIS
jgi:RNA ligase (TIGR02306 family)